MDVSIKVGEEPFGGETSAHRVAVWVSQFCSIEHVHVIEAAVLRADAVGYGAAAQGGIRKVVGKIKTKHCGQEGPAVFVPNFNRVAMASVAQNMIDQGHLADIGGAAGLRGGKQQVGLTNRRRRDLADPIGLVNRSPESHVEEIGRLG